MTSSAPTYKAVFGSAFAGVFVVNTRIPNDKILNLRAGPPGESEEAKAKYDSILAKVENGSSVIAKGDVEKGWRKVEYNGQEGWVKASMLDPHPNPRTVLEFFNQPPLKEIAAARRPTRPDAAAAAPAEDQIPKGTFDKINEPGGLSHKDYSQTSIDPNAFLKMVNDYRASKGVGPLKLDATLTAAAMAHSRDLAKHDRISHYGSDGSNPWDRIKRTGYNAKMGAENVATGQENMKQALDGWIASPGHNKNLLLADAKHVGFALAQDPRTEFKTFWTMAIGDNLDAKYKPVPPKDQKEYSHPATPSSAAAPTPGQTPERRSEAPASGTSRHASIGEAMPPMTASEPTQKKYAGTQPAHTPFS